MPRKSFKDYYPLLLRALAACWDGKPVGSDRLLAWIANNEPDVLDELRGLGYADAEDPLRKGWSWRQYLANALVRLSREGGVELRGHSTETPPGYFGPVGLWAPVGREPEEEERRPVSLRLPQGVHQRLEALARAQGVSLQAVVERALGMHPALSATVDLSRTPEGWIEFLKETLPLALEDAEVPLPLPQKHVMWVATALGLRFAAALDAPDRPWSVFGLKATLERMCGPEELMRRATRRGTHEEGSDLTIFTKAHGREWPLVAVESEAASWTTVRPDWEQNDYMWDFYKLFGRKAAGAMMVARVAGTAEQPAADGRMEQLAATLDEAVLRPYHHLLWFGQPVLIVLLPGSNPHSRALLGAAVAPGPVLWEWWRP